MGTTIDNVSLFEETSGSIKAKIDNSSNMSSAETETTTKQQQQSPVNPCWTQLTEGYLHDGIRKLVVAVGSISAKNPWTAVIVTFLFSLGLLVLGFFTNFELELNQLNFVTPTNSLPDLHSKWIQNQNEGATENSGFPNVRVFYLNVHNNGENVLNARAMEVALEAMEVLQSTPHYDELCRTCSDCSDSDRDMLFDGTSYCRISSVTQFWGHSQEDFQNQIQLLGDGDVDEYVRRLVSHQTYPDGTPVYHEAILGKFEGYNTTSGEPIDYTNAPTLSLETLLKIYQQNNGINANYGNISSLEMYLTSAKCLAIKVDFPDVGSTTDDFELLALEGLSSLQKKYQSTTNLDYDQAQVEYFTMNGYQYEMMRAMYIDMPLVLVLVVVMVGFNVLVFSDRHDRVQSRGMVGIYSFSTIGLSLWAGYGVMFIIGVPITTVAVMIPFVVCGVGLDDTFIITGTYFRLLRQQAEQESLEVGNENDTTITKRERQHAVTVRLIETTLNEVAVSISMTTITTLIAFISGGTSQVPAVRWLCWYAAISLFMVYIFQITCFIGFLVLDERRVQAKRKDLCIWIITHQDTSSDGSKPVINENVNGTEEVTENDDPKTDNPPSKAPGQTFPERLMGWYADQLLKPISKAIVLLVFALYFGGTVYSTALLKQEFKINDYIPDDSYMSSSMRAYEEYSTYLLYIEVYFRNVDQSDPEVQLQMSDYILELSELDQVGGEPGFFWLRDFRQLAESNLTDEMIGTELDLSFNQQLDLALSIPQLRQIYGRDIVRDVESGNITASRSYMFLREFDMYNVQDQIELLEEQRDISLRQPVNDESKLISGKGLNFFTFAELYFYWELFATVIDELIFNTIFCVVAVSIITLVLIPHWSAVGFACPVLIMLYFNFMGTMQYCGVTINVISYFILVMSIGLLVDFLMHVLLRFIEVKGATRDEKVKKTLETIGASILMGAFTTFLGVIPLAFSTTKIFEMVFICFLAMVVLGCAGGLVLLPVLLSLVGPLGAVQNGVRESDGEHDHNHVRKSGGDQEDTEGYDYRMLKIKTVQTRENIHTEIVETPKDGDDEITWQIDC